MNDNNLKIKELELKIETLKLINLELLDDKKALSEILTEALKEIAELKIQLNDQLIKINKMKKEWEYDPYDESFTDDADD